MRTLGYAIALGLTLLVAGPTASSPPPPVFDLGVCGTNATDIVVTDPDGVVLECWRGELRPGDIVRLGPARLTPANALPWDCLRLRPDRALSGYYRDYESQVLCGHRSHYDPGPNSQTPEGVEYKLPRIELWPTDEVSQLERRLVLFLRKEGREAAAVWAPVAVPRTDRMELGYVNKDLAWATRRVHQKFGRFSTSIAWVEAGRVLVLQASLERISYQNWSPQLTPIALDYEHFKTQVLALPAPPRLALDTKSREFTPSSHMTLTGLSTRLWAPPTK
ncbi:hypothetical protein FTUN_2531 [Frigoriglobus tundricola]|uniref:Uncharacterized protein n=2 Tax=Frigoriglobus tundricola TaxID=2774151 RepID=A0A6M5YM50_9BACT|nr:hypothetical protein FTUN_2531 [Frigoriglobus tundricola]